MGQLVSAFLDAFNRGDTGTLAQLVAPDGSERLDFKWFSSTEGDAGVNRPPRRHVALYSRGDFLAYVAERHRERERLQLIFVRSSTPQSGGREVGVAYVVRREANDLPEQLGGTQRVATGKAAFDCGEGKLVVWSMAMQMAPPGASTPTTYDGHLCPAPPGWRYGESPPVACWHGPNAATALTTFRPSSTPSRAPARCSPASVVAKVRRMLASYNFGSGQQVASAFAPEASLRVARDGQRPIRGRKRIAAFVNRRYMAGEGWTAVTIARPSIRGARAIYRLTVRIVHQGEIRGTRHVAQVLSCRSGLMTSWTELGWES